jgi:hypothetical protein
MPTYVASIAKIQDSTLRSYLDSTFHGYSVTKIHAAIRARIGSLSRPSKMPGHAWGLHPRYCLTGSKLAGRANTPCAICYATRGHYQFPQVRAAQERRLLGWLHEPEWVQLMALRIALLGEDHFRWFDSGDLQDLAMLHDITRVAVLTPQVQHWLPTQERKLVQAAGPLPGNLTVRISMPVLEYVPRSGWLTQVPTSSVGGSGQQGVHTCPSRSQGNRCQECRACWDPKVMHVRYLRH